MVLVLLRSRFLIQDIKATLPFPILLSDESSITSQISNAQGKCLYYTVLNSNYFDNDKI